MGMAASQARYLEITARKTNVEYEGQQINQQRTALANESAGMFTQLMGLSVPIPPSTSNYTTTAYTFNNGATENTVDSITPLTGNPNYNANVSYHYTQSVYQGIGQTRTDLGVNNVAGTYWLTNGGSPATNQTKLTQCATTDTNYAAEVAALTQIVTNNPSAAIANVATGFDPANAATTIGKIWNYTDATGVTRYYAATDLVTAATHGGAATTLTNYYTGNIDKNISTTEQAYVTYASSGRASSVQLASSSGATFALTSTTKTDEIAYNNAMNEYEYQQQLYQQQVTNINAKTSIIQQQDKTLELQLAQLDTEQKALSTEMDSVKKVIDKNIEQTFKTFS